MKKMYNPSRLILACLMIVNLPFLGACSLSSQSSFPLIPGQTIRAATSQNHSSVREEISNSNVSGSIPAESPSDEKITLRISGPWDNNQLELLGNYFEVLQNTVSTLDAEQMQGETVSLEWLEAYAADLNLQASAHQPNDEITAEMARQWTETDSWPDLIVTRELLDPSFGVNLADFKPVLQNKDDFRADQVINSLFTLTQSKSAEVNYLPWRFSIPVLYENAGQNHSQDLPILRDSSNWSEFSQHLQTISQQVSDSDRKPVLLAQPYLMMQYLPTALNPALGWSAWRNGAFNLHDPAVADALTQLYRLKKLGIFEQNSKTLQTDGNQIVLYQIGSTTDLPEIRLQMNNQLNVHPLPLDRSTPYPANPVEIYSIIVPAQSEHVELAKQLAAFLAGDINANLLQLRISEMPGYYPIVKDSSVWDHIGMQQPEISFISDLPNELRNAYTTGAYEQIGWLNWHQSQILDQWPLALTSTSPEQYLKQMQQQIEVQDG